MATSYKDTLNLPQTDFPIRPNFVTDDERMLKRWAEENIYEHAMQLNAGNVKYILHDGPPYANGNIHLGHAYNKILKDIVTKSYRMSGFHVPVTPGWDCHGLPIEWRVAQDNPNSSPEQLRKECRIYARKWVDIQREEFKSLGIIMDWAHPYITMDYPYEAKILQAFGIFVGRGFVERKNRTVPWCPSCQTVLASAEIEYRDRKDPSLYVLFPVGSQSNKILSTEPVSLLVWTTTPWTLPLNRAVAVHPGATYLLAKWQNKLVIIGEKASATLSQTLQEQPHVIKRILGKELIGLRLKHPFAPELLVPVIGEDFVGVDEGTAAVHIAPGCGPLDYEAGIKHNLEIYSPVSPAGQYTEEINPQELVNMSIADAQGWVIKDLLARDLLFYKSSIKHSYPHCWRCHGGLIFRATKQWFISLNHRDLKKQALQAVNNIDFRPPQGRSFLRATIESRWEWCLSRQRIWGVPIPALLCTNCDYAYCSQDFVNKVAEHVSREGVEYWEKVKVEDLGIDLASCPQCKGTNFIKERDILDVWFDSGVSHYAVLYTNPALGFPADVYCEGVDQHRGWFQSSLLTALVIEHQAPMKTIMVHGFTVDERGQKMSKSLGNVVAPADMIKTMGTDGLRLWVASIEHEGDAIVSEALLKNVSEVFRKIRNTCRFLLANLSDFQESHKVELSELRMIDRAILSYLFETNKKLINDYHEGRFTAVFHGLTDLCTVDLSSWYLDIIKDRLYVEKKDGVLRRSAQTACWYILDTLTRLMAPILSFTAEQISDYYQANKIRSIHLQPFQDLKSIGDMIDVKTPGFETSQWDLMREFRSMLLKAIEIEREKGLIKHPLEVRLSLYLDLNVDFAHQIQKILETIQKTGQTIEDFLKEFCIISQIELRKDSKNLHDLGNGVHALIERARGIKCPRCWNWDETSDELCHRCSRVLA